MGKRIAVIAMVCACLCAVAIALVAPTGGLAPSPEAGPLASADFVPATTAAEGDSADGVDGSAGRRGADVSDALPYEPGAVLVSLAEGAHPDQFAEVLSETPDLAGAAIVETVADGLLKLELPAGLAVDEAVGLLGQLAPIEVAQPNYRYYAQGATGQAPGLSAGQLALQPTASFVSQAVDLVAQSVAMNDPRLNLQWALNSIGAPDAWESVAATASPQPVTVAVFDEGFLTSHEDLASVITSPFDVVNGTSSANAAYNPGHSAHGTHVAGIIAAQANNGKGIAGVAYNTSAYSTCKVMPVKVADAKGGITTANLVKAYAHLFSPSGSSTVAQKLNVRIVNISLGTSRLGEGNIPDLLLRGAVARAWRSGIVTVAAACNIDDGEYDTPFKSYPSDFPNVVGVIGLTEDSSADGVRRDPTSNFNTESAASASTKNISAPGDLIYSTYTDDSASPATNQYRYMSGTSMAAPVVAGALALMFKANPELTASQATSVLYGTARDLAKGAGESKGWDSVTGYGEVDAAAAVAAVAPSVSGPSTIAYDATGSFSVALGGVRQSASEFTWTSSNEKVAKVENVSGSTCVIKPVGGGTAIIKATKGNLVATHAVTVKWPAITSPSVVAAGDVFECSVRIGGAAAPVSDWAWASSDEDVLQVTAAGHAIAQREGKAVLTVTNTSNGFSLSRTIAVKAEIDVGDLAISTPALTYTGSALKPSPIVMNGSYRLEEGVAYEVADCVDNKNVGTAAFILRGLRPYTGEIDCSFMIRPASVSNATITLSATSFTYNGKVRKPKLKAVTIALGGSSRKLKSSEFEVANPGVMRGTGKVTVKGVGNFTGTAKAKYTVKVVKRKVYQLYNRSSGQWFYTTSAKERSAKIAKGWLSKGVAFKTPSKSTKPVWRLYNPKTGAYRYTAKASQRKSLVAAGWKRQKTAFYGYELKAKRVYAFYRKDTKSWRYSTASSLAKYTRKSTLAYAL